VKIEIKSIFPHGVVVRETLIKILRLHGVLYGFRGLRSQPRPKGPWARAGLAAAGACGGMVCRAAGTTIKEIYRN